MSLGMTIDQFIVYTWVWRITQAMKKVMEVEPLYLDDNCFDIDELVYRVAGLNPFKENHHD